jgi:flagellar motor switch protein FliM
LKPDIVAKIAGVPVLACHYGTANGKYALKVDELLTTSNTSWLGEANV